VSTGQLRFSVQTRVGVSSERANVEIGGNPILFETSLQAGQTKLMAAGAKSGWVYVMKRESGERIWERQLGGGAGAGDGDNGILVNGAWTGKYLLFANNEARQGRDSSTLYALDARDGKTVWTRDFGLNAGVLGRITVANGVGFMGVGSELEVFDVEDGSVLQTVATGGPTAAGVASIANGIVAFGTGATSLAHDDADQGKLIVLEVPNP
jgi:outer membrane protein assembly factor BamB